MRKILLLLILSPLLLRAQTAYSDFVNPFVGTGGHGHTFPGAVSPFGMVQLSPDTRLEGWDGCSGYHYSDSRIYGFSHTHLSGTGVSDYGDILLKPMSRPAAYDREIYASAFSHDRETARPGYYSVYLEEDDILAELTATPRVGFHRYTFQPGRAQHLILDLTHRDEVLEASLEVLAGGRQLRGMRRSRAWAEDQVVYFYMEFDRPMTQWAVRHGGQESRRQIGVTEARDIIAALIFDSREAPLQVKVALSQVSMDGAEQNLRQECPHWDFEMTRAQTSRAWENELSKIRVKGRDPEHLTNFYTALYHCMIHPSLASDVDGQYRGMDGRVHRAVGYEHYTIFSLWDTYRALHPLLTIIDHTRTNHFIRSMLAMYQQSGRLPVWELSANETNCMIGYHAVSVIADAYQKNIRDWDAKLALEAMVATAQSPVFGLPAYMRKGYLEVEDESESVSKTLEYAYNDWCIADMARQMRRQPVFEEFLQRSVGYRHLMDRQSGFIRPRSNGGWLEPFDPREVTNHYTEANAWQYTFYAPHDLPWLVEAMGGGRAFEKKLDALFDSPPVITGRDQADITGLIGQYAQGNEPSHHMAYLYAFTGSPWKTQERVDQIMALYKPTPDGLPGNEDCGQMSAWYVFSAMGFYPVTPGAGGYVFGAPLFEEVIIPLGDNKFFELYSDRRNRAGKYIQDIHINKERWPSSWLPHHFIRPNVDVVIQMGAKPEYSIGSEKQFYPLSGVNLPGFVQIPTIQGPDAAFREEGKVLIRPAEATHRILYSTTSQQPDMPYLDPLSLNTTAQVYAQSIDTAGNRSPVVQARFFRIPHDWTISLQSEPHPQYAQGGAETLIDGLYGDSDWRKGRWLGFQGTDLAVTIDLGRKRKVKNLGARFLQDTRAWIVLPRDITISASTDGKRWKEALRLKNRRPIQTDEAFVELLSGQSAVKKARYLRIQASHSGPLPAWHPGAGGASYIFVDEIVVE
jgi:predicted alpha-1,2-mannosidase